MAKAQEEKKTLKSWEKLSPDCVTKLRIVDANIYV